MRVTGLQPYLGDVGQPLHNGCHSLHVARDGHVSDSVVMHDLYPSQLGVGGVHLSTQHLGGGRRGKREERMEGDRCRREGGRKLSSTDHSRIHTHLSHHFPSPSLPTPPPSLPTPPHLSLLLPPSHLVERTGPSEDDV